MKNRLLTTTLVPFGFFALAICAMFMGPLSFSAAGIVIHHNPPKDEIVVRLRAGVRIGDINDQYETAVREHVASSNDYLLSLSRGAKRNEVLKQMEDDVRLVFAGSNNIIEFPEIQQTSHAFIDQTSHAFIDNQSPVRFYAQPSVTNLDLTEAHELSRGVGVRVAVIDTGLDFSHPLFTGRVALPVYDFVDNDYVPADETGGPGSGHGTFVAGLIRLTAPDATIMPLRVFDKSGRGSSFDIARAIRYAADHGAQVINMSFGLSDKDKVIKAALDDVSKQVYMVASAGNEDREGIQFPANVRDRVISVTATTETDLKAPFANFDKEISVAAPGESVYSAYPGGRWAFWSGTSFSTALVTGEAAILLSQNMKLKSKELNKIMTDSGVNIDSVNKQYKGKLGRRINYRAAVDIARYK